MMVSGVGGRVDGDGGSESLLSSSALSRQSPESADDLFASEQRAQKRFGSLLFSF
jgi:hypothetical protein